VNGENLEAARSFRWRKSVWIRCQACQDGLNLLSIWSRDLEPPPLLRSDTRSMWRPLAGTPCLRTQATIRVFIPSIEKSGSIPSGRWFHLSSLHHKLRTISFIFSTERTTTSFSIDRAIEGPIYKKIEWQNSKKGALDFHRLAFLSPPFPRLSVEILNLTFMANDQCR
jgi:hypothetical protein